MITSADKRLLVRGGAILWYTWPALLGVFLIGFFAGLNSISWTDPDGWQGQMISFLGGSLVFAGMLAGASVFVAEDVNITRFRPLVMIVMFIEGMALAAGAMTAGLHAIAGSPGIGTAAGLSVGLGGVICLVLFLQVRAFFRAFFRERAAGARNSSSR